MIMENNDFYDDGEADLELENRIKNLMWTVSGDFSLDAEIDIASFRLSKYIALYDAVKQGAFALYFSREELGMYLAKKMYLNADSVKLIAVTQLAVEAAVHDKVVADRPGVAFIREKALEDVSEYFFDSLMHTPQGRLKLFIIRYYLTGELTAEKRLLEPAKKIIALEDAVDTETVIAAIDAVYNMFDDAFGHNLQYVLSVSREEMAESDWADFLKEEASEDNEENIAAAVNAAMSLAGGEEKNRKANGGGAVIVLDEEALKKMRSYIELTFGQSIFDAKENARIERALCRGVHENCRLYFTDGLLRERRTDYYRYKYAAMRADKNRRAYYDKHRVVKHNIAHLTDILKKEFVMRSLPENLPADMGSVVARKLWRVGRAPLNKMFERSIKRDDSDFVVDVLIDASGSQSTRQAKVSLQGYILAAALTALDIPVRIMGFCTFWEYTVLNVYRDYDDPLKMNSRLFEYMTTANNRDGLAVNAAVYGLRKRSEQSKVLIVLSDGRPHDVNINRPGRTEPDKYYGDAAVNDTALAVRRARAQGIAVLGVFAGREEDLAAEKKIFGKDFAYIRDIKDFSHVVGAYLKKQIENL